MFLVFGFGTNNQKLSPINIMFLHILHMFYGNAKSMDYNFGQKSDDLSIQMSRLNRNNKYRAYDIVVTIYTSPHCSSMLIYYTNCPIRSWKA